MEDPNKIKTFLERFVRAQNIKKKEEKCSFGKLEIISCFIETNCLIEINRVAVFHLNGLIKLQPHKIFSGMDYRVIKKKDGKKNNTHSVPSFSCLVNIFVYDFRSPVFNNNEEP